MHLFNLNDFAVRFGIDMSVADFADAVRSASKAATSALASQFRFRDFSVHAGRLDIFNVERMFGGSGVMTRRLRLSRGFVEDNSAFSVVYATSPLYIRNSTADLITNLQDTLGDGQSDHVFMDWEQGTVAFYGVDLSSMWIGVAYDCGMSVNDADEFLDVPDWLSETSMNQTAIFLKQNRIFQTENEDDTTSLKQALALAFASHGRYYPDAVFPSMSEPGR